ncbi:hypothetical protein TNCV_1680611 [Trichonephila clavipes]|nr:hypothetical protein TNCV_1680611 [Trichonephila clavipes]
MLLVASPGHGGFRVDGKSIQKRAKTNKGKRGCRLVAFCDVPQNLEPWSSDEEDTLLFLLPHEREDV